MLFCFCSFIHLSTWTLWHCFPNGGLLMPETWYLDWNYQCLASFSLREDNNTGKFHFLNIPQTKIFSNLLCINILAFESIFYCASYKYRHSLFFFFFAGGSSFKYTQHYWGYYIAFWSITFHTSSIQIKKKKRIHFVVQLLSRAQLFVTPWTTTRQDSLSCTIFWRLLKLMSTELVMPSHPLLSPPPSGLSLYWHQDLCQWVSSSHQVAKLLEFQLQDQSFQWIFRVDFL